MATFRALVIFAAYLVFTAALARAQQQVLTLSDLSDGVYSIQTADTNAECGPSAKEYLGFNNKTCSAIAPSKKIAGPVMRTASPSMMWREWLLRIVGNSESENGTDVTLQAFVSDEVKSKRAKCLGMVSNFYERTKDKVTCTIPPYGDALFLNGSTPEDEAFVDSKMIITISSTDQEGEFHLLAANKPDTCARMISVRRCESVPYLAIESEDGGVSSTWKLVKRQEIAADTPSSAPAPSSVQPAASPAPSSAQPAASPAPSAPSPTSSKDPPPPAPGPVISAPSTVLEPYVNVIVSSFGGDESCSPQKIVFEYGLSNGMITPAQTEVDARDSLKTLGVSLPLSTGDGIYSIYAYSLCSSGSKRTDRSNGLSVSVNTPAPLFYLSSNGVTVQCPAAPIGSVGIVNGITYTKRDLNQILSLVSQQQYDEIERTCTSGITSLNAVFKNAATFNGNIGTWDVSSVVSMRETFYNAASFNQDIRFWDTRSVTSLSDTFRGASQFNQPLTTNGSQWYTGLVTNMQRTFKDAVVFNQDISSWDTTSVTSLQGMFNGASSFNKPLATNGKQWNTSSVTNMHNLFYYATSFNQDISSWETQRVTDMHGVFHFAQSFNQPLPRDGNKWNTDAVTTMRWMFSHAISFDQDISGWIVSAVTDCYRYDRDASASWTVAEKPTFSVSCT